MSDPDYGISSMSVRAAMTYEELVAVGLSPAEARAEMDRRVFGHDVKYRKDGTPIEQGRGAPGHETEQHFQALAKYESQEIADRARAAAAAAKKGPLPRKRDEQEDQF